MIRGWVGVRSLADQARATADRAEAAVGAINVRLDNLIRDTTNQWQSLREDMRRTDERRSEDQKEWRTALGSRLDSQDEKTDRLFRTLWSVAVAIIALLLTVIGFFLSHLPAFAGFHY